ncbi:DUF6153 family protein [Streptomyces sp. NPDC089919]|uniref:DUF6153 family protein n=1 Tax=Streptomyces sp. NPDC089919 TaxID=3155188 RepID=UPI003414F2D6
MTLRTRHHAATSHGPPALRTVLLVLLVLAGVLAMHALPQATAGTRPHDSTSAHVAARTADASHTESMEAGHPPTSGRTPAPGGPTAHCPCMDHGHGGGHLAHADATCAAAGTSGGPVLPGLLPVRLAGAPAAAYGGPAAGVPGRTGGRAPPSLSELQLLRI